MANEIAAGASTGVVIYAVVRSAAQQPWNTGSAAFEAYQDAHWSSYAISMTEQGTSGIYVGSLPGALAAGLYSLDVRQRAGATAATSDTRVAAGTIAWTGSAESFVSGDAQGRVGVATNADKSGYSSTVAGYASGQDPATLLLSAPANKLLTTGAGHVQHDMTQAVPTSNTAQTVGDALNGARAQAFGRWAQTGTQLQLFAADGTTVVRTFQLDNALAPTSRS